MGRRLDRTDGTGCSVRNGRLAGARISTPGSPGDRRGRLTDARTPGDAMISARDVHGRSSRGASRRSIAARCRRGHADRIRDGEDGDRPGITTRRLVDLHVLRRADGRAGPGRGRRPRGRRGRRTRNLPPLICVSYFRARSLGMPQPTSAPARLPRAVPAIAPSSPAITAAASGPATTTGPDARHDQERRRADHQAEQASEPRPGLGPGLGVVAGADEADRLLAHLEVAADDREVAPSRTPPRAAAAPPARPRRGRDRPRRCSS